MRREKRNEFPAKKEEEWIGRPIQKMKSDRLVENSIKRRARFPVIWNKVNDNNELMACTRERGET
jgi:hypothetical protein